MNERGTMERTLQHLAARGDHRRPYCRLWESKFLTGYQSTHLTRSGRLYNGLLRIYRFTHKQRDENGKR